MISVLLPVFNGEKFLRQAVDSVLNQSLGDFEFIILDDGSTDSSNDIVNSYKDSRIKHFQLEHRGIPKTLNYGLSLAKYDYVAIMNQDDICFKRRFEKQVQFLWHNPQIDILGTNYIQIDENANIIRKVKLPEADKYIKKLLPYYCSLQHSSTMFKKYSIKLFGGYNTNYLLASDWELYLNLIEELNYCNLQNYLLMYRVHNNNASGDLEQNYKETYQLIETHFNKEINEGNQTNENLAKAYFDLGYFYYLQDDIKFKPYFRKAFYCNKTNFRYFYFFAIGAILYPLILFLRKTGAIKLLIPLRKLDKNHLFFRID